MLIESLARVPVEVDIASEFRYRDPLVNDRTVVFSISQSGETADTLAAMEEARSKGATLRSIVNVIGSAAMRAAHGYITMQSGPEIGVASTKAFTAPLADLYLLAMKLGELRGALKPKDLKALASTQAAPRLLPVRVCAVFGLAPRACPGMPSVSCWRELP